jgi:Family of unknown function (DUF5670)/AI-2E family transporter
MDDMPRTLKPWVTFAGCVLVVVVLYWAQAVLVAIALAILLTFVLTPPVTSLQRWIGRIPAVLAIVTLVFTVLGLAGWGLARQMDHLAEDLPRYRVNILAKIADVRGAGKGGSVEKLQETIEDIRTDLGVLKSTDTRPRLQHAVLGRGEVDRLHVTRREVIAMLYTIAVILLIAWVLGLVGTYTIGAFVHVLLVVAIVLFVMGLLTGRRTLG